MARKTPSKTPIAQALNDAQVAKQAAQEAVQDAKAAKKDPGMTIRIEGNPLSITVPPAVVTMATAAMHAAAGATQKWVKSQPDISAAFGAPLCYETGNPQSDLLREFLREIHPLHAEVIAAKAKIEIARRAKDDKAERLAIAERNVAELDIDVDTRNAYRSLAKYYKEKQDSTSVTRGEGKSLDDYLTIFAGQMQRVHDKKGQNQPDMARAAFLVRICREMQKAERAQFIMRVTPLFTVELPAIAQPKKDEAKMPGKVQSFTGKDAQQRVAPAPAHAA
jgi:hypothetical protein